MAKSNSSIWVSLGLNTDKYKKGVKGARSSTKSLMSGLGSLSPIALGVSGAIAGLGLVIGNAVGIFKDFEKANSDLKAVLNPTNEEMKSLTDQSKALGASTAFTATEVAGLQKEYAKLGFSVKQIENMTEATLDLAAATGTELAEAATQVGATINAFGLQSAEATHVTDVMAASFASSALDMEKFSETMKNAAPIARATGVSLELATAAAGKLADANITGSKAGTDLRRIFSELVKDGKPFKESLNDIAKEMDGASTKAEKLAIAENLVGRRAKAALLILIDQKESLGKLETSLEGADGAAKRMADTMLDNLSGDITRAASAWEGFILSLEDGTGTLAKATRGVVKLSTTMLGYLTGLAKGQSTLQTSTEAFISLRKAFGFLTSEEERSLKIQSKLFFAKGDLEKLTTKELRTLLKLNPKLKEKLKNDIKSIIILRERGSVTKKVVKSTIKLSAAEQKRADNIAMLKKEYGDLSPIMSKSITDISRQTLSVDALNKKLKRLQATQSTFQIGSLEFQDIGRQIDTVNEQLKTDPRLAIKIWPSVQPIPQEEIDQLNEEMDALNANAQAAGAAVGDAFSIMGDRMADSLGDAETGLERFQQGMLKTVMKIISMALANAVANAIVSGTQTGSSTGPAAVFTTPAFIATAVGGVIGAFASIPAFAEGGLVTGATMGLVGEGMGTSMSNPEVIAPLDKLKKMMGSDGGFPEKVTFEIKGKTLVGILQREAKFNKFS